MNSGPEPRINAEGTVALVKPHIGRVVDAWMKDGADAETVGRRLARTPKWVNKTLHAVQEAFGFESRTELALALERGQVRLEVEN